MRWFAAFVGLVLILLGVLAFTGQFPGKMFSFTSSSEQRDAQQLEQSGDPGDGGSGIDVDVNVPGSESESTERSSFPLAPVLGVIAVLGGLILVGKAMSRHEHHHHHRDVHVS